MDSKTVNKQLRAQVRPVLKSAGFTKFTDRNSWLVREESKWVVNFQSFNSHLADGVGCTTFSFGVNLGVSFDFHRPWPDRPIAAWPKEYEATIRFNALKTIDQPFFNPYGTSPGQDRPDVFFVFEDGSNLDEVINDVRLVLERDALPALWLYDDPLYAYCSLLDQTRHWPPRSPSPHIEVLPCGNVGSPHWVEVVTSLGRRLDRDPQVDIDEGLDPALLQSVLGRS